MRKLSSLLLITFSLLFVPSSCEKDDAVVGNLVSATFSPATKKFTLTFSQGGTKTIDAIIDNSVNPPTASAIWENKTNIYIDDATVEGPAAIEKTSSYRYVNNWIYEQMNIYYLWNDKIPKSPDFTERPDKFFDSLLNKYNKTTNPKGDRFSWIQEDYSDLVGSLSGVSSNEIGFEYIFVGTDENNYYALVTYPKLGSDAYNKGIDRGRFITAVDGKNITKSNYRTIFSGSGIKKLSMADFVYNNELDAYRLTKAEDVSIQMEKDFAEIPVYMDSVYNFDGHKIGYLVYNFFAEDNNDNTHKYEMLLMDRLASIKAKEATEMVLDLRYNRGGAVSTAIALASALVKDRSTDKLLASAEYNNLVHTEYKKRYGDNYNKDYFIDKIKFGRNVIEIPSLDITKLYVLVTGGTASASELIINGLKPYMDVILIGETTYGKNVGSISIYEPNDPKNKWGMQPIIAKYYNSKGESDYTNGFKPDFEVDEFETLNLRLVEFGNTEDPLLSVAINQITNNGLQARSLEMSKQITVQPNMFEKKGSNSIFKDKSRFEMYDDVRGEEIKKIMNK